MHFYERLFLCVLLRFRQLKFSFKPWVFCKRSSQHNKRSIEKRNWWLQRRAEGRSVFLRARGVRDVQTGWDGGGWELRLKYSH